MEWIFNEKLDLSAYEERERMQNSEKSQGHSQKPRQKEKKFVIWPSLL